MSFNCDKCGKELDVKDVRYIACEGLFCEKCEVELICAGRNIDPNEGEE